MAKNNPLAAETSAFAHLLGGVAAVAGRALGRRAEEDKEQPDAEDDQDQPDAEGEDTEQPEGGKRGKKADADDADPDAEADDTDPDAKDEGEDEPEGKKAVSPYRQGFAAANKRARAIFAAPEAAGRPDLAAQLAFGTSMSAAEAIGVMGTVGAVPKPRGRLDDRMGQRVEARPGAGGGTTAKTSFGDRVAAAVKKAGR